MKEESHLRVAEEDRPGHSSRAYAGVMVAYLGGQGSPDTDHHFLLVMVHSYVEGSFIDLGVPSHEPKLPQNEARLRACQ